jgi:hypothetical protein
MFLRYSIKISSWLLLTVVSFNFDRYQFSNDLFILLFYKRWSGRIPQTTKLSIDLEVFISVWKQRFHISVETNLLFVHISVRTYILIFDIRIQAVSWLSLNAVEVKQTSHLLDVCRFRLFLWQFDGFFRKPLEDFPLSSIFNTTGSGDVNIIYSVVQTGERTTDRGTNSTPNIKRLCNGKYRPGQLYILSSRVFWCLTPLSAIFSYIMATSLYVRRICIW